MARISVLCWQEIPSAVEVREGAAIAKQQLSPRFMELIDMAAMRRGLAGTDAYLGQWRKERQADRAGSADEIARTIAAELEANFDTYRSAVIAGEET